MNLRTLISALLLALMTAVPAYASEVTGTLTAGSGSTLGGTVTGPPSASPAPGTYANAQSVTLSAPGASSIRYTTDGSAPNCTGTGQLYVGPISVVNSTSIQAISCYSNGVSSSVASFAYFISNNTLSGTVATSSGGTLSGTVAIASTSSGTNSSSNSSGSGGSSSSGGGGGGGAIGSGAGGGSTSTSAGTGTGSVLGASTTNPNLPNTGAGGEAAQTIFTLLLSGLTALAGFSYLAYRFYLTRRA